MDAFIRFLTDFPGSVYTTTMRSGGRRLLADKTAVGLLPVDAAARAEEVLKNAPTLTQ